MQVVGVISDTHGLLRSEAKSVLLGVDALIHAGDIGKPDVINELREIAPLTVIRGNVDKWADDLPDEEVLKINGRSLYILHNLADLDLDPKTAGFDVVISGHSHKPSIMEKDSVLYLNPGSAGPRRFSLPIAVAKLFISDELISAEIIEIPI